MGCDGICGGEKSLVRQGLILKRHSWILKRHTAPQRDPLISITETHHIMLIKAIIIATIQLISEKITD